MSKDYFNTKIIMRAPNFLFGIIGQSELYLFIYFYSFMGSNKFESFEYA